MPANNGMQCTALSAAAYAVRSAEEGDMARTPLQAIVIPFRKRGGGHEFAVFHRADGSMWQFVSGGAEIDESARDAAMREAQEEARIPSTCHWIELDSRASVPRTAFPTAAHWPHDLFVVPEYSFAVDVTGLELLLSHEHDEVRWLSFEEATRLLTWESNRIALWELQQRLKQTIEQSHSTDAGARPAEG